MSADAVAASYGELIELLDGLPLLVRETRRRRGLSQRAAGEQSGTGWTTISRCENGAGLHVKSIVPLLRWIGTPDAALLGAGETTEADQ